MTEHLNLNWTPYPFQSTALDWIDARRRAGLNWTPLFMCTGSGKSVVVLEDMMRAAVERNARRYLIISPMTVTGDWLDKAEEYGLPMRVARVRRNMTRDARIKMIRAGFWDVLVVNYDSARLLQQNLLDCQFHYLVLDECQYLKNATAAVTRAVREISRDVKSRGGVRVGLSGTPAPKDLLDYWSQFDVLDPYSDTRIAEHHPLGLGSYRSYESLVANKESHPRLKGVYKTTFHPMMVDLVKDRVGKHAFQVTKEEALPFLPPQRFEQVKVDMTPVQAKLYDIMREDMVLAIKSNGEAASEQIRSENVMSLSDYLMKEGYKVDREMLKKGIVTAKIETVAMMRLHQITCGHINTQDGGVKTFDGGKIEYLSEHLEQWCDPFEDNKSIIFTAYRPSVELLTNLAAKLDIGVLALTGKTSGKAQEMVRQFQTDPGVRLFVINLAAGSTGITLTRANRVCYYASTYNWMHRRQSEDRAHRIGQTRSVMYTDLMIRNSIEQHVLNKLEGKADMQARTTTSFLELFA